MASITIHQLGKNGLQASALGFGLMGPSMEHGQDESDRALELEERFWDNADVYGDSEDIIGKWFKQTDKRNEV